MQAKLTTTRIKRARRRGRWIAIVTAAAAGGVLPLLPAAWALRSRGPAALDGIESLDDAVTDCQRSGLTGWDLVTYAQRLVYRKFRYYSCRNLWDTPAQAFRRGMGYCTQYNLALKQLLDRLDVSSPTRLGFDTQEVFALRVAVADNPAWAMGHTWLRVRVDGETRDVCAGHAANLPGQVSFTPLAPVLPGNGLVLFLTHLGLIGYAGFLEWQALLATPVHRNKKRVARMLHPRHPIADLNEAQTHALYDAIGTTVDAAMAAGGVEQMGFQCSQL